MPKRSPLSSGRGLRRSDCPVACALDLLGDRWTLLVVRDLILGKSRFKEFAGSPEGIPTNILSDRLQRLLRSDVVEQIRLSPESRHLGYRLTSKGHSLLPLLRALRDWGLAWEKGTQARLTQPKTVRGRAARTSFRMKAG